MSLPRFEVQVAVEYIDSAELRVVFDDEISDEGIGDNRLYFDTSGVEWASLPLILAEEREIIAAASQQAVGANDFDRSVGRVLAQRYPDDADDDTDGALRGFTEIDLGVISAVAALSAAGCITTTSCRGHALSGETHPLVRFTTSSDRLGLIRDSAESAGCGLLLDGAGMLQLYGTEVSHLMSFAQVMYNKRGKFDLINTRVGQARNMVGDLLRDVLDPRVRDLEAASARDDNRRTETDPNQLTLFDEDR